jgi:hypothetical protein
MDADLDRMFDHQEEGRRWRSPSFGRDTAFTAAPQHQTVVILHSLAVSVEQLCARARDGPSIDALRPKFCVACGEPCRDRDGVLQIVGHGMYSRQVRGVSKAAWIVISVRRFLCLACGHTISRLPDWLHPWRWYAATAIVEALYRHCILREPPRLIGIRFGRPGDEPRWRSLDRWRVQLLMSPTLWGWLGPRLAIRRAAANREEAASYLSRLLAEGNRQIRSGVAILNELPTAVRATLKDLIHNRKQAGLVGQFPPGFSSVLSPVRIRQPLPTQKGSGRAPPG